MNLFWIGIQDIFQPYVLFLIFSGSTLGIVFGAIPGLTATMGVVLALPLTFKMTAIEGIALLVSVCIGGISGGLVSATLLRMPGTPSSVATTFDAFPMAQNGKPGRALGIGICASFIGGIFSSFGLALLAPPIANFALNFGYFEIFSLSIFALTTVSSLSKGTLIKGLLSACFGLFFTMFGAAPIDMNLRFTFGLNVLDAGFSLLPVLIGLFAISQVMKEIGSSIQYMVPKVDTKNIMPPISMFIKNFKDTIRSSLIGFFIGVLPGLGGATANVVSYGYAKSNSKNPEKFGTGYDVGIIASESSNNASTGGALIPLITLGIPGDSVGALLIAGLMMHGIQPGPLLLHSNQQLVYSIFISVFVANIMMFLIMLLGIRVFISALKIPKKYLIPTITVLCVVGSYALNNRMFDVYILFIFGIVGFLMEKYRFPLTPLILGFILGPILESNLRQGLMSSRGSFLPIFTRPISLIFILLALFAIVIPVISNKKIFKKKHKSNANTI